MAELSAHQMADALRKCGGTIVCEGCPYAELGTAKCIQQMQQDAAALIEGMQAIIDQQTKTIQGIRTFVRGNK